MVFLPLKKNVIICYWLKDYADIQGPYNVGSGLCILSRQLLTDTDFTSFQCIIILNEIFGCIVKFPDEEQFLLKTWHALQ